MERNLQRKGGLSDSGLAADKDQRAGDDAAAQKPVDFRTGLRRSLRPNDPADLDDLEAAWTGASTIVFHSLHAGHWPIHFGLSFPQFVQYHNVFALGIRTFFKCISILLKMCGEDTLEKLFPSHILTMLF